MSKIEKLLLQSVTVEMVAEQLTESEIEEVITECEDNIDALESEIENAESIERKHRSWAAQETQIANAWEKDAEKFRNDCALWVALANRAREALESKRNEMDATDRLEVSPNKRRAKVIEEAKEFIRKCESTAKSHSYDIRYAINKDERGISAMLSDNGRIISLKSTQCHPDDVWNKHIGKAIAIGRALGIDVSEFENAPQPTEIVEGMDVITYEPDESIHMEGRVKEVYEKHSNLIRYGKKFYEKNGYHEVTCTYTALGFKITSDTKAKYGSDDE